MLLRNVLRFSGVTWCRASQFLKDQTHSGAQVWKSYPRHVLFARGTQTARLPPNSILVTDVRDTADVPQGQFPDSAKDGEQMQTEKGFGTTARHELTAEQLHRLRLPPDQPDDARMLRVAIIGLPNSGKSSLTNSLMGWRISAVSKKVHTTRKNTTGIFTKENVQIVFLDTPGILDPSGSRRHNVEKSLVIDPERSLQHADLVGVVVDVSDKWSRNELDPLILQVLHVHRDKTAVLILNKVDLLRTKEMLLQITRSLTQGVVDGRPVGVVTKRSLQERNKLDLEKMFDAMQAGAKTEPGQEQCQGTGPQATPSNEESGVTQHVEESLSSVKQPDLEKQAWMDYVQKMRQAWKAVRGMKGWPHFKCVFMVSALSGDGVADLRDYLIQSAKEGDWYYHSSLVTSQDPREVITMCVKEKLLEHLPQEIPYTLDMEIVLLEVDENDVLNVVLNIVAQNHRQASSLLQRRGEAIQRIASEAKQEIMNAFRCEVRLKLVVKVKPWRK
ncbi:hypothetical protein BaRGS_00023385 [Batillaria attramentaria]|uniref:GTPase Era, mitochondrial n=1 Tax=Batillaria attramentaria TaxID=370345 RepID=A0ABD0KET0_9CAEN